MKRMEFSKNCSRKVCMCLTVATIAVGCGRMLSIDYQPTNPWKGEGALGVSIFRYDPAEDHRVRPREVETSQVAKTELFLSQEIGAFFSEALRRELIHSGYTINESSPLSIWGSIGRFFVDWRRSDTERFFELRATYNIQSGEKTLFSWTCSSAQEGPNILEKDGILIRKGVTDCMKRFIQAFQEAHIF